MDRQQLRAELGELVTLVDEDLVGKLDGVEDSAMLRDGLGMDSLQVTELIFEIEEKFDIKIQDEEAMQLRTIDDLLTLIEGKLE
jgi:acyl carrier protein